MPVSEIVYRHQQTVGLCESASVNAMPVSEIVLISTSKQWVCVSVGISECCADWWNCVLAPANSGSVWVSASVNAMPVSEIVLISTSKRWVCVSVGISECCADWWNCVLAPANSGSVWVSASVNAVLIDEIVYWHRWTQYEQDENSELCSSSCVLHIALV